MKSTSQGLAPVKTRGASRGESDDVKVGPKIIQGEATNAGLRDHILLRLSKHEGESVSDIARALDVLRPSASRAIGELQKAGLVEKRGRACFLTASGQNEAERKEQALPHKAQKTRRSMRQAVQQTHKARNSATRLLSAALLIDATDLDGWAQRLDARNQLPRLVRRLIFSISRDLKELRFPAGEGVQSGGWDGFVVYDGSHSFVPTGTSVWEMGTDKNIKGKADEDYEKRTVESLGLDRTETTFVFVTPRRWSQKEKWVKARRAEGEWRDVKVYDADDLETWLAETPAVHLWLSLLLGKHPRGAQALSDFWTDWATSTSPAFTPDLVVGGRNSARRSLEEWLASPTTSSTSLRGEARDEPIAFLASVISLMDEPLRERLWSRAVVVEEVAAWRELIASSANLLLIPRFAEVVEGTSRAIANGHQVFLAAEPYVANVTALPRLVRDDVEKALEQTGLSHDRASELATLARRSLWALRRRLASEPMVQTPPWARPEHARELLAACLASAWQADSPEDRKVLEQLASTSYTIIEEAMVRWSKNSEPPVRRVGGTWMIVAPEDAWRLLAPFLTKDDLARFQTVVVDVLRAPPGNTPLIERLGADLSGEPARVSGTLREGLASTLALMMALAHEVAFACDLSGEDVTSAVVRSLLRGSIKGIDNWSALAPVLPLLAEAAPTTFLDAVEEGLRGEAPVLGQMFQTKDDGYGFGPTSPHNFLLWALETLAWNREHLSRAALALGRLVRLDPGAKDGNHPLDSLRQIFVIWYPNTTAPLSSRTAILNRLSKELPDVAWPLLLGLLPSHYGATCLHPHGPKWHSWKPDEPRAIPNAEMAQAVEFLVEQLLLQVGSSAARWSDLIERAGDLWPHHREKLLQTLEATDFNGLSFEDALPMVGALRDLVTRHEEFSDADWAMSEEHRVRFEAVARRIEPHDPILRHQWLFKGFVHLPERRGLGWQEHEKEVRRLRGEALREIIEVHGVDGVFSLAEQAEDPESVGITLGQIETPIVDVDDFLADNLADDDPCRAALAIGWVRAKAWSGEEAWLQARLQSAVGVWTPSQWGEFFLPVPLTASVLDQLDALEEEAQRHYWMRTPLSSLSNQAQVVERIIPHLLQAGRITPIIHILRQAVRESKGGDGNADESEAVKVVAPELIMNALNVTIMHASAQELGATRYETARLLDHLEKCDVPRDRLAHLEWLFFGCHEHVRPPKVLYAEIGADPALFVELLCLIYRARPGETETYKQDDSQEVISPDPEDPQEAELKAALGRHAYSLLFHWHRTPGLREDGTLDEAHLKEWVARTRELGQQHDRSVITLIHIGHALAHSPRDEDGAWPHRAVRDIIDDIANPYLESGFSCQVFNNRGVTSRGLTDGGAQERALATRYENDAAQITDSWPRTASVLRALAQDYKRHAEREDLSADLTQDFWR